ncbi:MAG: hypothetical protein IAI48_03295 [Candidatus Eremiobacteraeota bacterium]|nr:hypothetical protein [Candidatus Eremiobacteraeota bacterium]
MTPAHLTLAVTLATALGTAPPPPGFALEGGVARVVPHFSANAAPGRPLTETFDFWTTRSAGAPPLERYDVEMTKQLHVVIVDADFATFGHVHATAASRGHLRTTYRFPHAGSYYVYTDSVPHGAGQQVFRWNVTAGPVARGRLVLPRLGAPNDVARAGPYVVRLDRSTLAAGAETKLAVEVTENGAPAHDLHPYLGAAAHAVFLSGRDLSYVHVHPVDPHAAASGMAAMPGMDMPMPATLPAGAHVGAKMLLHARVAARGRYKLWLQFRGGDALEVAQFVLDAR